MKGTRNQSDCLWGIQFPQDTEHNINDVISRDQNKTELAQYMYGCTFSPAIFTFQKCIQNGNVMSWHGIEDLNFKKLLDTTEATIKGHLDQERKNVQSAKTQPTPNPDEDDAFPRRSQ